MNLFKDILGFIFNKFKIFIVILLILATAPYVWGEILNELEKREILLEKATELKEVHENIPKTFDAEKSKAEKRIGKLNRSGTKVLKERIGQIDKEITDLKSKTNTPMETVIATLSGDLEEVVTNKINLGILEQERKYLEELYNFTLNKEDRGKREKELKKAIKTKKESHRSISSVLGMIEKKPLAYVPGTELYEKRKGLEKNHEQLSAEIDKAEKELRVLNTSPDEMSTDKLKTDINELEEFIQTKKEEFKHLSHTLDYWKSSNPFISKIPKTNVYEICRGLEEDLERLKLEIYRAERQLGQLKNSQPKPGLPVFFTNEIDKIFDLLDLEIKEIEEILNKNWVQLFLDFLEENIKEILKNKEMASMILLSIILMPLAIKAFFYYIIAPIASRSTPICMLPNVSGIIAAGINNEPPESIAGEFSAPALTVSLNKNEELFVHQGCIQQMPSGGEVDTEFVLNWKYPLMSIAAGMYSLTRIRESDQSCKIGANPVGKMYIHQKVGLISIPAGSAIIFQPHYLVGVIQHYDQPVKITSHWRLGSLNAWLTLQLRYLAFHGPVKLIIEGCNGVNVECADKISSINQASTIGFSANLNYSTSRSKPFVPYLMGRQELFNDNFTGASSYYIYEQTPYCGKKGNILTGRGIEGITDSVLKVFGI